MKLFKNFYANIVNFGFAYKEDYKKQNIKFALTGYRFTKITAQLYVVFFGIPYAINFSIKGKDALIAAIFVKPLNHRKGYMLWDHNIVQHYLYKDVKYNSTYAIKRKNMLTDEDFTKVTQQDEITAFCYNGKTRTVAWLN